MDIAFTGQSVLLAMLGILVLILGTIFVMRNVIKGRGNAELAQKYDGSSGKSPLVGRNKYPEVDAFKWSGTFLNTGIALALGLTILAFSWTTYEEVVDIPEDALVLEEDIEIEPPRTAEPPPPPKPKVEEIFKVVEQMPRFPGCEDKGGSDKEKKQCADKKMLEFIYKNIKYPAIARENGVEGTCVIQFVVEKSGEVKDAKVVRDIGAQCGAEALRVVELMNTKGIKWTPGKQRGRAVRVQFNLPVKFRLE